MKDITYLFFWHLHGKEQEKERRECQIYAYAFAILCISMQCISFLTIVSLQSNICKASNSLCGASNTQVSGFLVHHIPDLFPSNLLDNFITKPRGVCMSPLLKFSLACMWIKIVACHVSNMAKFGGVRESKHLSKCPLKH